MSRGSVCKKALLGIMALLCSLNVDGASAKTSNGKATASATTKQVLDLTHTLGPDMPDFHGDRDAFTYSMLFTIPKDGFADGKFSTPEHYGTHIDAPCHFAAGAKSVDQLPAQNFVVPCVVLDVRNEVKSNPDYCVTLDQVKAFEKQGAIPKGAVVLALTGWAQRWSNPTTYRNADDKGTMHFPGFTQDAAEYLSNDRNAVGLGIDTLSLDPGNSTTYGVHGFTLKQGMYLIENLDNLDKVPARGATLIVAPLRIKNGTGSPSRIYALLP